MSLRCASKRAHARLPFRQSHIDLSIRSLTSTPRAQEYIWDMTPPSKSQPDPTPDALATIPKSPSKIASLLATPSWSVQSLIPPTTPKEPLPITPSELNHLLNLSALPQPTSPAEETDLLHTLTAQLHFVNAIRSVDTTGVEPLAAIRDETEAGERALEVTSAKLAEALRGEEHIGQHFVRIRRKKSKGGIKGEEGLEGWKPLDGAVRREGVYFVVEKEGKKGGNE